MNNFDYEFICIDLFNRLPNIIKKLFNINNIDCIVDIHYDFSPMNCDAMYFPDEELIALDKDLLMKQSENHLKDTIIHEVSHYINRLLYNMTSPTEQNNWGHDENFLEIYEKLCKEFDLVPMKYDQSTKESETQSRKIGLFSSRIKLLTYNEIDKLIEAHNNEVDKSGGFKILTKKFIPSVELINSENNFYDFVK